MAQKTDVEKALQQARRFVFTGVNQILSGKMDESHGVSPSPGATALAVLALLALGQDYAGAQRRGRSWLLGHRQGSGWGKYPGDMPDVDISRLVETVIQGSQGSWIGRVLLLSQARQFSEMVLSLGQKVVPGLEGPSPEEIRLPGILQASVLTKLPPYGRSVVVAAALLSSNSGQEGNGQGLAYLMHSQMEDGSWSEDVVATSMAVLALVRWHRFTDRARKAGQWLVYKQYAGGAWPAFDQLQTWSIGWALNILKGQGQEEVELLRQAEQWLKRGQNTDGSYGSTPSYAQPDLDDTAIALMGLPKSEESRRAIQLLKRLQNQNGSWGTFPSFTGVPPKLKCEFPVYIASTDVTLHILEALWRHRTRGEEQTIRSGLQWLINTQKTSGVLESVWFEGPIYGTAQLVELLGKWRFNWQNWQGARQIFTARHKAQDFLLTAQNRDGSWGSSVSETALSLSATWHLGKQISGEPSNRATEKLLSWQLHDGSFRPSYQGIYAKGWNYEEPLATALTVIRAWQRYLSNPAHKALLQFR